MSNILDIIGKNIRHHREKSGLSQLKLAYQLEISPSYLVGIETARQNPSIKILEKFATFFGVETYELLKPPSAEKPLPDEINIVLKDLQVRINCIFEEKMVT